jgi:hypothetical protein
MPFYEIHYVGDYGCPIEVGESVTISEKDGKYFAVIIKSDGSIAGYDEVYNSKKKAWKAILAKINEHISNISAVRTKIFHAALDDNAFAMEPDAAKTWIEQRMNETK